MALCVAEGDMEEFKRHLPENDIMLDPFARQAVEAAAKAGVDECLKSYTDPTADEVAMCFS